MNLLLSLRAAGLLAAMFTAGAAAAIADPPDLPQADLPQGYWGEEKTGPILSKTITLRLAPDLSMLSEAERAALEELLAAGKLLHALYLKQNHHQALSSLEDLHALDEKLGSPQATQNLLKLYRMFKGPIATTLANEREAFLPVDETVPGKNMYPWGVTREELDAFLAANPDVNNLLDERTVVRRSTAKNAARDLAELTQHPALDLLHPDLRERLENIKKSPDADGFYAVPYAVAYADRLVEAYEHLRRAAALLQDEDPDFSAYLENRARDLLTNDYESGDASWVTGEFGDLNAQIGSYETYDDELYGTKTFFSGSLLVKDEERSRELRDAIADIQAIENSLPYDRHKKVRSDIPVGVYNVIADFGQARGTNTASILPNDADHSRKYGRTILLRYNIMTNPELFIDTKAGWNAAVADDFENDLTLEGGFQRTLWHEIGHYLGVATDEKGRDLDLALQEYSDLLEEMKADLVSLYAAPALHESGYYTDAELRALYADGVRRTLQRVQPRRSQSYGTMQLMQMNYFLENGLLSFDEDSGQLVIHYDNYHDVVGELLAEVLAVQSAGDPERAEAFVDRYTNWDENLHGVIAENIRDAVKYRYRLVRYEALGE
ncbi:MAG TPA: NUDIX hydrolase [Gammaproteobacteria bacterium]